MSCYELSMAVITLLGIIITVIVTNKNTNRQIKNTNKQNNKPIIFVNNVELIATHDNLENCNLFFDKYSNELAANNLENRIVAQGPSTIKMYLSNCGVGIAKDFYIFNKKNGEKVNYFVTESENKWIKKGNVLLIPNGQDNSIEFVPQYIREEELRENEEKCSDYCNIRIYYSDINDNFYFMDLRFEILYLEKQKQFAFKYYSTDINEVDKKEDKANYNGTDLYNTLYKKGM